MLIAQRIAAAITDIMLIALGHILSAQLFMMIDIPVNGVITMGINVILSFVALVLVFGFPYIYYRISLPVLKVSPGKYLFGLRLSQDGYPVTAFNTLFREVIKILSVFSGFGALYAFVQIRDGKDAWYDHFLNCSVTERSQ